MTTPFFDRLVADALPRRRLAPSPNTIGPTIRTGLEGELARSERAGRRRNWLELADLLPNVAAAHGVADVAAGLLGRDPALTKSGAVLAGISALPLGSSSKAARAILRKLPEIERAGGATLTQAGEHYAGGGYSVGLGKGKSFRTLDARAVEGVLRKLPKGANLGIWRDPSSGRWFIEPSETFTSLEDAARAGGQRGERAIWDHDAGESLTLLRYHSQRGNALRNPANAGKGTVLRGAERGRPGVNGLYYYEHGFPSEAEFRHKPAFIVPVPERKIIDLGRPLEEQTSEVQKLLAGTKTAKDMEQRLQKAGLYYKNTDSEMLAHPDEFPHTPRIVKGFTRERGIPLEPRARSGKEGEGLPSFLSGIAGASTGGVAGAAIGNQLAGGDEKHANALGTYGGLGVGLAVGGAAGYGLGRGAELLGEEVVRRARGLPRPGMLPTGRWPHLRRMLDEMALQGKLPLPEEKPGWLKDIERERPFWEDETGAIGRLGRRTSSQARALHDYLLPEERQLLQTGRQELKTQHFEEAARELLPAEVHASVARAGAPTRGFYHDATPALERHAAAEFPRFAQLIAATSPRTRVETNFAQARPMWDVFRQTGEHNTAIDAAPDYVMGNYRPNIERALTTETPRALDVLSGPKVQRFAQNLMGNYEPVTLDSWMAGIQNWNPARLRGKASLASAGKEVASPAYLAYSARVRQAAEQLGITPAETQAAEWGFGKALVDHSAHNFKRGEGLAPGTYERNIWNIGEEQLGANPDVPTLLGQPGARLRGVLGGTIDPEHLRMVARNLERFSQGRYRF